MYNHSTILFDYEHNNITVNHEIKYSMNCRLMFCMDVYRAMNSERLVINK